MTKITIFLSQYKLSLLLLAAVILVFVGGFYLFQKYILSGSQKVDEVELFFDEEGPYAQLVPRRDGNAIHLIIKRTASYDAISYELSYNAEGVDRGVVGDVDTSKKKGEYEQEILFGTCSKNVCKYDKGVENGTLTLKIKNGKRLLKMITTWHLQKVAVSLGVITSGDGHFIYKADTKEGLDAVGFTIVNDLTGVPKLPSNNKVFGKVYSLNTQITRKLPTGVLSINLAEKPPQNAKIVRFDEAKGQWEFLETKVEGSKLESLTNGAGIFAVLILAK